MQDAKNRQKVTIWAPWEIDPTVWGISANFNGFRVLAALLHGTPVVGVSQTLRR